MVKSGKPKQRKKPDREQIRLNKFLAHAGICSRRDADELIADGRITVNGKVCSHLGTKIVEGDIVKMDGKKVSGEQLVYILMNKPKDCITTTSDERGRRHVIDLLDGRIKERVYPVGRLDRNTTGLLILSNDGTLANRLTHPSYGVRKIYMVHTDKEVLNSDLKKLCDGIELEDGLMKADNADYSGSGKDKMCIGLEIHSGRKRVVRRLFEALGYKVLQLDRTAIGPLTKKGLPRGKWRHLKSSEIRLLLRKPHLSHH